MKNILISLLAFCFFHVRCALEPGPIFVPDYILIDANNSPMGCTSEQSPCETDESPQHDVKLSIYYLSKYELTQKEWKEIMVINPSGSSINCDNCPVENISWYDAIVYCNRRSEKEGLIPCYYSNPELTLIYGLINGDWSLPNNGTVYWNKNAKGYRLPTEAEWECAARGGTSVQTRYSGSDDLNLVAWTSDNSGGITNPVGGKFSNIIGIYDMSGNVLEWCYDWYSSDYYKNSPVSNPQGPTSGSFRIARGGSLSGDPLFCRVAKRSGYPPDNRDINIGFRWARTK